MSDRVAPLRRAATEEHITRELAACGLQCTFNGKADTRVCNEVPEGVTSRRECLYPVPALWCSSVTGEGLPALREHLANLLPRVVWDFVPSDGPTFLIDEVWPSVSSAGHPVVGGVVLGGAGTRALKRGDKMVLGPFQRGKYMGSPRAASGPRAARHAFAVVRSIQRHRIAVDEVAACGQPCTIALELVDFSRDRSQDGHEDRRVGCRPPEDEESSETHSTCSSFEDGSSSDDARQRSRNRKMSRSEAFREGLRPGQFLWAEETPAADGVWRFRVSLHSLFSDAEGTLTVGRHCILHVHATRQAVEVVEVQDVDGSMEAVLAFMWRREFLTVGMPMALSAALGKTAPLLYAGHVLGLSK